MDPADNLYDIREDAGLDAGLTLLSGDANEGLATWDQRFGGVSLRGRAKTMTVVAVLSTFNRAHLLGRALDSALSATVPAGCKVSILVVDNNSTDQTAEVVADYIRRHGEHRIRYLFEKRQGKQFALNLAIANSSSDIVAMFDDDEVLEHNWFEVIAENFQDSGTDFIGGPYRPDWSGVAPESGSSPSDGESVGPGWVPRAGYGGVLGIIDNGPVRRRYGSPGFHGMLAGGNSAIRRSVLERCGPYSDDYMYAEDRYMYGQLLKLGAVGYYVPDLVIYHHVPAKRLKKSYFRHWALTEGCTNGAVARDAGARHRFGAPLWMWRRTTEAAARVCLGYATGRFNCPDRFKAELDIMQFAGFFQGKFAKGSGQQRFDRS